MFAQLLKQQPGKKKIVKIEIKARIVFAKAQHAVEDKCHSQFAAVT